ncbi:hypothetical protein AAHE18_04G153400 [Arachis hypogaea]
MEDYYEATSTCDWIVETLKQRKIREENGNKNIGELFKDLHGRKSNKEAEGEKRQASLNGYQGAPMDITNEQGELGDRGDRGWEMQVYKNKNGNYYIVELANEEDEELRGQPTIEDTSKWKIA